MTDLNKQFTPKQKQFLARFERQVEVAEQSQAREIIAGCHNKFQFAKTYRTLRNDFARKNQQLRDRASEGDVGVGVTPELVEEMIRVGTNKWQTKMAALQKHFVLTWGEPIENYAGKGDGSGCAGVVAVALLLIGTIGVVVVAVK